ARELGELRQASNNERLRRLQRWRKEHRWPRVVGFEHGPYLLPVDLDNVLSVDAFIASIEKAPVVELIELPESVEQLEVRSREGPLRAGLVFSMERVGRSPAVAARRLAAARRETERVFAPGRAWLSASFACGPWQVDDVLTDGLASMIRALRPVRWFFVRY